MRTITTVALALVTALAVPLQAEDLIQEDRELLAEIQALVHKAVGDMEVSEISVAFDEGVVTLTGELNRLSYIENARYAAAEVPGVVEVVSEVEVATAIFDPEMVEKNVLRAFRQNPDLAGSDLGADCVQGEVTLSGDVADGALKELAATTASGVDGVQSIVNEIATPYHSDEQILGVLNALLAGSQTNAFDDVSVEVSGGYVTLRGTAPLLIYAYLARDAALAVDGVTDVALAIDVIPSGTN